MVTFTTALKAVNLIYSVLGVGSLVCVCFC
nr:MAG TPA: hypothetical protein [Microviridae sp.]